jgi:hypothetical protein
MFRRLASIFILVAYLFSNGGHWCVLQSIAWVNMVQDFSESVSTWQAVKMAVSGQYPCSLCKKITTEKQKSHEAFLKLPETQKIISLSSSFHIPTVMGKTPHPLPYLQYGTLRFSEPPTPPPQVFSA